ncbi:hypothetical protein EDB19DRAFT_1828723 [Suillus lakei]|nr:hypothetical protein EDB19DRAFT_1828723 [Suillus lakei]
MSTGWDPDHWGLLYKQAVACHQSGGDNQLNIQAEVARKYFLVGPSAASQSIIQLQQLLGEFKSGFRGRFGRGFGSGFRFSKMKSALVDLGRTSACQAAIFGKAMQNIAADPPQIFSLTLIPNAHPSSALSVTRPLPVVGRRQRTPLPLNRHPSSAPSSQISTPPAGGSLQNSRCIISLVLQARPVVPTYNSHLRASSNICVSTSGTQDHRPEHSRRIPRATGKATVLSEEFRPRKVPRLTQRTAPLLQEHACRSRKYWSDERLAPIFAVRKAYFTQYLNQEYSATYASGNTFPFDQPPQHAEPRNSFAPLPLSEHLPHNQYNSPLGIHLRSSPYDHCAPHGVVPTTMIIVVIPAVPQPSAKDVNSQAMGDSKTILTGTKVGKFLHGEVEATETRKALADRKRGEEEQARLRAECSQAKTHKIVQGCVKKLTSIFKFLDLSVLVRQLAAAAYNEPYV